MVAELSHKVINVGEFTVYDFMRHYNIPRSGYLDYPFHFSYHSNREIMHQVFNNFYTIAETRLSSSLGISLVCRGSSGVFVSAIFFELLRHKFPNKDIRIIYVRKEGEKAHDKNLNSFNTNYLSIFVDDFIESGETVEKCYKYVNGYFRGLVDVKFDWCVCSNMCSGSMDRIKLYVKNLVCNYK
jgi:hypothetical protein